MPHAIDFFHHMSFPLRKTFGKTKEKKTKTNRQKTKTKKTSNNQTDKYLTRLVSI